MKRIKQKILALFKLKKRKRNSRNPLKRVVTVYKRLKRFRESSAKAFAERERKILQLRELHKEGKLDFHKFKDFVSELVLLKRSIENNLRFLKGREKSEMKQKLVLVNDSIKRAQKDLLQARKLLVDAHYEHLFDYFFHPQRIDFEPQFDEVHGQRYLKIDLEKVGDELMKVVREVDFNAVSEIVERLVKSAGNLTFIQREPGAKTHLEYGLRTQLQRVRSEMIIQS